MNDVEPSLLPERTTRERSPDGQWTIIHTIEPPVASVDRWRSQSHPGQPEREPVGGRSQQQAPRTVRCSGCLFSFYNFTRSRGP